MRHISSAALALVTSLCMAQFGPYERFAPSTTSVVGTVLVDLDDDGDVDLLEYRATYAGATGALMWRVNDGT
ncbi:MAG: hypothetical protein ABI432_10275, partial [Flavobacteriales bacterium]